MLLTSFPLATTSWSLSCKQASVQATPLHTFAPLTVHEHGIVILEIKVGDDELPSGSYELHVIESAPLLEATARNLFVSRVDGRRIYAVLTDATLPSRHGTAEHSLVCMCVEELVEIVRPLLQSAILGVPNPLNDEPLPALNTSVMLRSSPAYRITFTLLSEQPVHSKVDMPSAFEEHFSSTLASVAHLADFAVDFQWKPFSDLPITPERRHGGYRLTAAQQATFVNGAWTIDQSISKHPQVHFLLYVAPTRWSPLQIDAPTSSALDRHSFWYPQWGGVYIADDRGVDAKDAASRAFRVFEQQFRILVGLDDIHNSEDAFEAGFAVDRLTWQRMLLEHREARTTIQQLHNLVARIPNMPVPSSLPATLGRIEHDLSGHSKGSAGSNAASLNEAYGRVKRARHAADAAFFDPSMLARLYFPQEHKLGVYAPLFFPTLFPIAVATLRFLADCLKSILLSRR